TQPGRRGPGRARPVCVFPSSLSSLNRPASHASRSATTISAVAARQAGTNPASTPTRNETPNPPSANSADGASAIATPSVPTATTPAAATANCYLRVPDGQPPPPHNPAPPPDPDDPADQPYHAALAQHQPEHARPRVADRLQPGVFPDAVLDGHHRRRRHQRE